MPKDSAPRPEGASRKTGRALVWVVLILALAVVLLGAGALVWSGLQARQTDRIFPGTLASGVNVGGMRRQEAERALREAGYGGYEGAEIAVSFPDGGGFTVTAADLGLAGDLERAMDALLAYGRQGDFFLDAAAWLGAALRRPAERLSGDAARPDEEALRRAMREKLRAEERELVPSVLFFDEKEIRWTRGQPSLALHEDDLCETLLAAFQARDFRDIAWTPETEEPAVADVATLYELVAVDAMDAYFDDGFQVVADTKGLTFDLPAAELALREADYGQTVVIPLFPVDPGVTAGTLEALLYRDLLSTATSTMAWNETRSNNIALAAASIDGLVLLPGEEFSYNTALGERTTDKGYGKATAYLGGRLVQEVGGGICQLSSTLYYCCLLADLEILYRTNHSYFQSYVPYGMDATVSWGWPDFTFRNNRDYPIRLQAWREEQELTVEIWGTNTDGAYVEMEYIINAYDSRDTVYEEDASLAPGETRTLDGGQDGMRVTTYRCRYDAEGTLLERAEEAVSRYNTRDKRVAVAPGEIPGQN